MQQRPYLKICGERILGGVGNFQNKLTAIATAQVKVLIALAEQCLGFNYRKRVCLGHGLSSPNRKRAQYGSPAAWHQGLKIRVILAIEMADPLRSVYNPGCSPSGRTFKL
jgi:hypothetical protein